MSNAIRQNKHKNISLFFMFDNNGRVCVEVVERATFFIKIGSAVVLQLKT